MTGLEALEYLDEHNLNWHDNPTKNAVNIIKKELKAFQLLFDKNILNAHNNGIISIWETKLSNGITYCYEMQVLLDNNRMLIPLTKEQFELLKEVFKND